jgi:hypothetical protein
VQQLLDEIDVASSQMLDLDRAHRAVRGDDSGAVHVLPFLIRCSGSEEPPLLVSRQRSADWMLALW